MKGEQMNLTYQRGRLVTWSALLGAAAVLHTILFLTA